MIKGISVNQHDTNEDADSKHFQNSSTPAQLQHGVTIQNKSQQIAVNTSTVKSMTRVGHMISLCK
jgi:hypothetical protein